MKLSEIIVVIKGAGEMASAVAWRIYMSNIRRILMLETPSPLAVRREVFDKVPFIRHQQGQTLAGKVPAHGKAFCVIGLAGHFLQLDQSIQRGDIGDR